MRCMVAVFVLLTAGPVLAHEATVLFNGDFETVDSSGHVSDWNYPADMFAVDSSGGMNGTKALRFSGSTGGYGSSIQQRVRVVPGRRYDFGCMIRTDDLKGTGMGARICVQFEDVYGRFIEGQYQAERLMGTHDWTKSFARTQVTPKEAFWATVRVEVVGPCVGKAVFDDVYFRCDDRQAVECIFSDRYRDEASDGEVTFGAGVNAAALASVGKPYSAKFAYVDANGESRFVKPAFRTGSKALLTLPVSELTLGESKVAFVISNASGKEIGRKELTFLRSREKVRRRVSFSRSGLCLVDDKPFFPLGMYWSVPKPYHTFKLPEIDEKGVKTFSDSPFNCVMAYKAPSVEQLNVLHRHGIKSIYNLASSFGNAAEAARRIKEVKDHPAVLAWYLQDEKPISMLDDLIMRRRTANGLDPDHPTWICVYQYADAAEYYRTTDVMGCDPYPVSSSPISLPYKWATAVRDSSFGLKPFWQVPQAFDWGTFRTGHVGDRMPTEAEMKSMAWQHIAGGANGLIFYSFTYLYQCKSTPFEKAWADTRTAAQTIKDNFDILLSEDAPPTFEVKDAVARTWRRGKKVYALVLNHETKPVRARFKLGCRARYVKNRFGVAPTAVEGGFQVELGAIDQALFEFSAE